MYRVPRNGEVYLQVLHAHLPGTYAARLAVVPKAPKPPKPQRPVDVLDFRRPAHRPRWQWALQVPRPAAIIGRFKAKGIEFKPVGDGSDVLVTAPGGRPPHQLPRRHRACVAAHRALPPQQLCPLRGHAPSGTGGCRDAGGRHPPIRFRVARTACRNERAEVARIPPPRVDDFNPPRLEDYYQPKTPQEQPGLAAAFARRDANRLFRRVIRMMDRRIEAMKAQDAGASKVRAAMGTSPR